MIPNTFVRLTFLVARRRAMASGDAAAVSRMHDVLQSGQRAGTIPLMAGEITAQLDREYAVLLTPQICHR